MGEAVSSGEEQSAMGVETRGGCKEGSDSVVRWERFLPKMVVRVLLVEADDSTRQLISALLRKCNYKVAAVADGLRAWEVLKERSRNIDLILTEVELPSISGFALLSLITEDEICKNIPVIMMSSHDSIGTVHKCMMRGASDFLMKPIRINELKNLWQHVWRKQSCQSTLGFGLSLQVESSAEMKVDEATAENNAISDNSCGSKALPSREDDYFRKGSDAQNSCTNPSLEARSAYAEEESQGFCRIKKLKPPVCNAEALQDDEGMNLCTRANIVADGDLCKGVDTVSQGGKLGGHRNFVTGNDLGSEASERTTMGAESSREAIDLIGAFDSNKGSHGGSCPDNGPKILESSDLNLTWRGLQLNGFESNITHNSVLIQSNASAFSRYTNKQSQVIPRESTTNSLEQNNRSAISLPMQHREKPMDAFPYEQHRPHPVPITARDISCSQHFTGGRPVFHEQHFVRNAESRKKEQKVESGDKKMSFSAATDQSGSESFCNGVVSHTHWPVRVNSGNMNPGLPSATSASENGNIDERFIVQEKNLQHCTQREAALMKFRLKRKERCYEKKVRYESRKKLADQRPRIKGQFVRRIPPDPPPTIQ